MLIQVLIVQLLGAAIAASQCLNLSCWPIGSRIKEVRQISRPEEPVLRVLVVWRNRPRRTDGIQFAIHCITRQLMWALPFWLNENTVNVHFSIRSATPVKDDRCELTASDSRGKLLAVVSDIRVDIHPTSPSSPLAFTEQPQQPRSDSIFSPNFKGKENEDQLVAEVPVRDERKVDYMIALDAFASEIKISLTRKLKTYADELQHMYDLTLRQRIALLLSLSRYPEEILQFLNKISSAREMKFVLEQFADVLGVQQVIMRYGLSDIQSTDTPFMRLTTRT